MASQTHRPRRSCLYMPGANERALEKARSLPADTLLLDLEDAVAPDAKLTAREAILNAVKQGGYGYREIVIRMNGLGTEWGADDLKMAVSSGAKAVLAPKVESAADIHALDKALTDRIRAAVRSGASPRHVPARVVAVADIPRTKSGKIVELAVREVVHGRPVKNVEALANPEALEHFRDRPELAE